MCWAFRSHEEAAQYSRVYTWSCHQILLLMSDVLSIHYFSTRCYSQLPGQRRLRVPWVATSSLMFAFPISRRIELVVLLSEIWCRPPFARNLVNTETTGYSGPMLDVRIPVSRSNIAAKISYYFKAITQRIELDILNNVTSCTFLSI